MATYDYPLQPSTPPLGTLAIMQSEAELTRQSKRLSGQNLEYTSCSKQPSLAGSRAPSRIPSRIQSPSNTPSDTFLHSAADTEDPQSTPTQKGNAAAIQIVEPTLIKPLGRLSADPDSEDDASEPPEYEPESEPASPYAKKAIKHLQRMYQKLYSSKD